MKKTLQHDIQFCAAGIRVIGNVDARAAPSGAALRQTA